MCLCVCAYIHTATLTPSAINTNHVMLLSGIHGDFLSGIWKCGESGCSETPSSALSARNPPQKGFKDAARQRQKERERERRREREVSNIAAVYPTTRYIIKEIPLLTD